MRPAHLSHLDLRVAFERSLKHGESFKGRRGRLFAKNVDFSGDCLRGHRRMFFELTADDDRVWSYGVEHLPVVTLENVRGVSDSPRTGFRDALSGNPGLRSADSGYLAFAGGFNALQRNSQMPPVANDADSFHGCILAHARSALQCKAHHRSALFLCSRLAGATQALEGNAALGAEATSVADRLPVL